MAMKAYESWRHGIESVAAGGIESQQSKGNENMASVMA
jgi:hypothetical protein